MQISSHQTKTRKRKQTATPQKGGKRNLLLTSTPRKEIGDQFRWPNHIDIKLSNIIDWLIKCYVQWQIFHAYSGREYIDEWWWWSLLRTSTLSRIFNVLAHESNSPQEDMPLYPDTLFWLWADQSFSWMLCAVYSRYQSNHNQAGK